MARAWIFLVSLVCGVRNVSVWGSGEEAIRMSLRIIRVYWIIIREELGILRVLQHLCIAYC